MEVPIEGGEESKLLEDARHGDTEAFSKLVEQYQRPVYFTAMRMVSHPEDAADIAQQTFINGFRALPTFRRESSFKTWLIQIAINLCRNHIKARMHKPDFEDITESDVADYGNMPFDQLTDQESSARLRRAIETLSEGPRTAVILRVYEDYSYEQIAKTLGCREETARVHFHHGLRALRKALTKGVS